MSHNKRSRLLALPADVKFSELSFHPDQDELNWLRWRAAEEVIKREAMEEQRAWLAEQNERLARISEEINEAKRKTWVAEEKAKREAWWAGIERAQEVATAKLLADYQKMLDAPAMKKLWDRVNKAGREIARDAAKMERQELLRRGVVRGRRR